MRDEDSEDIEMVNVDEILAKMEKTARREGICLHPSGRGLYCRWDSSDGSLVWVLTEPSGFSCLPVSTSAVSRDRAERYLREASGIFISLGASK